MPEHTDTKSTALVAIDFHGDQIVTLQHEGVPSVAMRRVVENLGLVWARQLQKLKDDPRFACSHMYTHDAMGRRQEMLVMPIAKLALWLATVNPNKVPDLVKREKIELYQAESAIVLHDYWTKGVAMRGDLDGIVTGFDKHTMGAIGGMVKRIVAKALAEVLPAMVRDHLTAHRLHVVEGVSALEVLEIAGFVRGKRPRGMAQFASAQLCRYHEDRQQVPERSRHGSSRVRLFNEGLSRRWLSDGGARELDSWRNAKLGIGQIGLRLIRA